MISTNFIVTVSTLLGYLIDLISIKFRAVHANVDVYKESIKQNDQN